MMMVYLSYDERLLELKTKLKMRFKAVFNLAFGLRFVSDIGM
jgi:hypothetical protein